MIPLQHCMPAALAELLSRQPLSAAKVEFAWRTAVGAAIGRATTVRLADDGTLEVWMLDARWGLEVERSAPLIQIRLETLLGPEVVRRIRLRPGGR